MQRADPAAGTATREMSRKTESEGHLSAASFGYLLKCICATKATESPEAICRTYGKLLQKNDLGSIRREMSRETSQAGDPG